VGNQKHYQADPASPLYEELCGIARKTFGIAEPLRRALVPLARKIKLAFIFGSVAKRSDRAASDIDLMVVSDKLSHGDLYAALERISRQVGRMVNPTVYSTAEFEERRREGNAFISRVIAQPRIWIVGSEHDLAT
jgi:predicted nucleotidyltransferase